MNRSFGKTVLSLCLCALILVSCAVTAFAADCNVDLSASDGTVGDTISLSVYASGDIAAATITISYDTTKLTWTGGGSDNYGSVTFDGEHSSGGGDLSFYATFTATAAGTANFNVVSYDIVDSGANNMNVSYDSTYSDIAAVSTASSESRLSSLSVGSGSISPGFSSNTTEYSLYVGNSTDYLSISATPKDSNASVYVSGQDLDVGDNAVYITVTAEDLVSTTTYVIYVYREGDGSEPEDEDDRDEDEEEETPASATLPDGTELEIVDYDDNELPKGFTRTTLQYDGQTVDAAVHSGSGQYLVYLLGDDDHDDGFRLFDAKTGAASPITWLPEAASRYLLLPLPEKDLPEGYKAGAAKIGDLDAEVLTAQGAKSVNHYIVYALNEAGQAGFYLFDIDESTFQRYDFAVTAEVTPSPSPSPSPSPTPFTPTPSPEPTASPEPEVIPEPWHVTYFPYLAVGAVLLFAGLLLWAVWATAKLAAAKKEARERKAAGTSVPAPKSAAPAAVPPAVIPAAEPAPKAEDAASPVIPAVPEQPEQAAPQELDFNLDDIIKEFGDKPEDEDS